MRQVLHLRRQSAEHRHPPLPAVDGIRAGTVQRRPDELGRDVVRVRRPRRGYGIAAFDRSRVDPQPVASSPAADEALGEDALLVALGQRCSCRLVEGHRLRELQVEVGRLGLGDERVSVAELEAPAAGVHVQLERPLERRREPERDLDGAVEERREDAAGVPAVRGFRRPAKMPVDDELHDAYTMFSTVRRKL